MSMMHTFEKPRTGILGFDESTGGSLPKGCATPVLGTADSGKSVLALQFLAEGIRKLCSPFQEEA